MKVSSKQSRTRAAGVKKLSAILVISIFLVFVATLAILCTKRSPSNADAEQLPPGVSARGLFAGGETAEPRDDAARQKLNAAEELERNLLERAQQGELQSLRVAHATRKTALYQSVLAALVERAASNTEELRALARFLARSEELRSSASLAEKLLEVWKQSPSRASTAELLRVAALSDDAAKFEQVLTAILRAWEEGRLGDLSAGDLRTLFESEYWLLSSEAKRSGAGFQLKQTLADARRRLSSRAVGENPPTDANFPKEAIAQKERT